MKPGPVHPGEDTWRFERPDALVKWCAENKLAVHGHTLVWHAQTNNWFFAGGDKEAVTRRMKDHITTLVGRYKGKVQGWDVVNEAINDGGNAETAKTENLRNSQWLRTVGPEFLTLAFKFAHEADPDAKLYYNDYGIEAGPKHESSMVLLRRLIKDGAPIHGVGIQGHWSTANVPYEAIDKAIADYASLGLKVSITELDVTIRGAAGGQFGPGGRRGARSRRRRRGPQGPGGRVREAVRDLHQAQGRDRAGDVLGAQRPPHLAVRPAPADLRRQQPAEAGLRGHRRRAPASEPGPGAAPLRRPVGPTAPAAGRMRRPPHRLEFVPLCSKLRSHRTSVVKTTAGCRTEARKTPMVDERCAIRPNQRGGPDAGAVGPGACTPISPSSRHTLSFMPASPSSSIAARYRPFGDTSRLVRQPGRHRDLVGDGPGRRVPEVDAVRHGDLFRGRDVVARDQHPAALRVGHPRDVHRPLRAVGERLHDLPRFHVADLDVLPRRRPFREELAVRRERQRPDAAARGRSARACPPPTARGRVRCGRRWRAACRRARSWPRRSACA